MNRAIQAKNKLIRTSSALIGGATYLLAPPLTQAASAPLPYPFANRYGTLGGIMGVIAPAIFSIAGIGILFYIVFAAVTYITAGDNKEQIAKARAMVQTALIGFIILIISFIILQYITRALLGNNSLRIIGN